MLKRSWVDWLNASRDLSIVIVLLFNTFTWFYMTLTIVSSISNSVNGGSTFEATYYLGIASAGLIGAVLSSKIRRINFLYLWLLFGIFASALPAVPVNTVSYAFFVILCMGASFGVGMPSCLAYFSNASMVENRGRLSGLVFLTANLCAIPTAIAFSRLGLAMSSLIATMWRGLGLTVFFAFKPTELTVETRRNVSFGSVLNNRSFLLYLIPWLMFSLLDKITFPMLNKFFGQEFFDSIIVVKLVIGASFALIGGALSDLVGRKKIVICGFVALGLAYAGIGIAPTILLTWYLYHIIDSIAAGILWVTCILIIWGDHSPAGAGEKYYVIGNMPFFLANALPVFLVSSLTLIPAYAVFSLSSFFLFLAVLPLIYASETLPEKSIELRRLKGYVEQAKKVREKYLKRSVSKG